MGHEHRIKGQVGFGIPRVIAVWLMCIGVQVAVEWRFSLIGEPVRDKARESRSYQCPTMYRCNRYAARNAASQNPITDDPTVTTSLPANQSFGYEGARVQTRRNRPKSQINRTTKPA